MSLKKYQQKRRFDRTPEPKGNERPSDRSALRFVIQKHDASRLHYDFRLELDGVLKSWAVPKGPSLDPARKALAVQVEDHPIEYGGFEGVIPKGEYGGGTVLLWDHGTWEPLHDPREGYKSGKLHFVLHGEKLHGEWSLVRMHGKAGGDGKNWLLIKVKDKFASSRGDILKDQPQSVKTKREIEQIADERDDVWDSDSKNLSKSSNARKSPLPTKFSPQLAVLADHPPEGDEWIHEIKFDGYRLLAFLKAGKVKLVTRNGHDWTNKFPAIAKALAKVKVDSAIIDGEAVMLDNEGRSDFQALQAMLKNMDGGESRFYVFDLPFYNGLDLTQTPLIERKKTLKRLFDRRDLTPRIVYSDHVQGHGDKMIQKACGMSLEGIISKRADSLYVSRREATWLKSKCQQRQEFVIIGFTNPEGARIGFGSLLLGYHNKTGELVYAGRVGTGFDEKLLKGLHTQLTRLEQKTSPTTNPPPPRERRAAHWVKPTLVAEVRFTGWTRDGMLRHPAFIALRSDKPASKIVRERPIHTEDVPAKPKASKSKHREPNKTTKASKPSAKAKSSTDTFAGVRLTHPDKVLYADQGITKIDVANYYQSVEKWMLPHVIHRPLALVRCPAGQSAKCFFQRNWSPTLPKDVAKIDVSDSKKKEWHVAVNDLAGIISLVQISVLEIHTWNCLDGNIEHPDQLIFDLDPGPDVPWKQVVSATRTLHNMLDTLRLPQFLKTSGGKGMHITIPIEPNIDWDTAKEFCGTIVKSLAQSSSDLFVANMRKDLRGGKVYIDYHRNGRSATAVAPYSTRARPGAPVSMPISWEELGKLSSAAQFTVESARRYLERRKTDPWRDFDKSRVDLHRTLAGKSAA